MSVKSKFPIGSPEGAAVFWSYAGTAFSLGSSFLLLPFLVGFLTADDLGLWYIFLAIAGLAQLFEFGFNPAFSRNFVYCLSGARELAERGGGEVSSDGSVNWHLYRTLVLASRTLYGCIAVVVLILVAAGGTLYINAIASGLEGTRLIAWCVFVIAIFLNLYYLYALSNLAGMGDVVGENKAKVYSNIVRLAVSIGLLFLGWGIAGAAIGYFMQGVLLRFLSIRYIGFHKDVSDGVASDSEPVTRRDTLQVLHAIAPVAWRNGLDQIALFMATQGTSIIASLYFTLAQTGVYSLGVQLANALGTLCLAHSKAYYPAYQGAFARGDESRQRSIIEKCVPVFWATALAGIIGVLLVGFPVLRVIRPDSVPSVSLFLLIAWYAVLMQHHTLFCNFILATNRIPFLWAFIVSSVLGVVLSLVFVGSFGWGPAGLVGGQALTQLAYNNWKWPHFVTRELSCTYKDLMVGGLRSLMR